MIAFVAALSVALVVTPLVVPVAKHWQLMDVPNQRSLHESPVPRGGGIAIIVATCVGVFLAATFSSEIVALLIGAVVLGIVGLVDDRFGLPAPPRLAMQLSVPLVTLVPVLDGSRPVFVLAPLVMVVMAGFVNAFNFMDGINGISGVQAAVAGIALGAFCVDADSAALAMCGWAVSGAALGFLPFNAIRPRLFLGDVGSYFLGFWLAGLAVLAAGVGVPVLVVVSPFLLYLGDTTSVLVRRARRGERLTEAHREHAYQRVTQLGYSHAVVAVGCGAVSAACALVMWFARSAAVAPRTCAFIVCLGLVGGYVALPALLERRSDRLQVGS